MAHDLRILQSIAFEGAFFMDQAKKKLIAAGALVASMTLSSACVPHYDDDDDYRRDRYGRHDR
jgi:hypothetical protein